MVMRPLFFSFMLITGTVCAMENEHDFSPRPVEKRSEKAKAMRARALRKDQTTLSTLKVVREENKLKHFGISQEEHDQAMTEMATMMKALQKQQSQN